MTNTNIFNSYYELIADEECVDIYVEDDKITVWGVNVIREFNLSEEANIIKKLHNIGFRMNYGFSHLKGAIIK